MIETTDVRNDDGTYKLNPFQKLATHFSTMWPPLDILLLLVIVAFATCMTAKRNLRPCLLKPFSTASKKCCMLLSFWIVTTQKNSTTTKSRSCSFILFLSLTFATIFGMVTMIFNSETLEDLKNFCQGHYYADQSKKSACCDEQGQASCPNKYIFTHCENTSDNARFNYPPSCCSNNIPCD